MTKIVERHRTTIGLLNVDVTDLANMSAGYQAMTDRRLEEIERRILALDAAPRWRKMMDNANRERLLRNCDNVGKWLKGGNYAEIMSLLGEIIQAIPNTGE